MASKLEQFGYGFLVWYLLIVILHLIFLYDYVFYFAEGTPEGVDLIVNLFLIFSYILFLPFIYEYFGYPTIAMTSMLLFLSSIILVVLMWAYFRRIGILETTRPEPTPSAMPDIFGFLFMVLYFLTIITGFATFTNMLLLIKGEIEIDLSYALIIAPLILALIVRLKDEGMALFILGAWIGGWGLAAAFHLSNSIVSFFSGLFDLVSIGLSATVYVVYLIIYLATEDEEKKDAMNLFWYLSGIGLCNLVVIALGF